MRQLIIAALSAMFVANLAWADAACDAAAAEKKLSGAAKTSFLKKCEADAAAAGGDDCNARADAKKLSGAARTSFVNKCTKDAASATCNAQAADKKLAGAAKNSFVKKCVTDSTK